MGNLAAGEAGRLKVTSVFDIARTDAIPVAERPTAGAWLSGDTGCGDRSLQQGPPFGDRLGGSVPELLHHQLAALVRAEGYRFVHGPLPPRCPTGTQGTVHFGAGTVTVRSDLSAAQRAKTTAHLLAHVLLHAPGTQHRRSRGRKPGRALREFEAESVASIVTAAHGVDAGSEAFRHVPGTDITAIQELVERVHDGTRLILDRLGATSTRANLPAA